MNRLLTISSFVYFFLKLHFFERRPCTIVALNLEILENKYTR